MYASLSHWGMYELTQSQMLDRLVLYDQANGLYDDYHRRNLKVGELPQETVDALRHERP